MTNHLIAGVKTLLSVALLVVLLPLSSPAQVSPVPPPYAPQPVLCDSGAVGRLRTYLSINNAAPGDTRADANHRIRLQGLVYIPEGTPPAAGFPVIVFNHGSEQDPSDRCELADYFVTKKHYILFVPIRRGHVGSTGEYVSDYSDRIAFEWCATCTDEDRLSVKLVAEVEYLRDQRSDVLEAIRYLQGHYPKVNDHRIAVMGQSYGAIVSLFFNMLGDSNNDLDTKAVVDISAGAQSWGGNAYLRQELKNAVLHAQRPIYFLQPLNDASTLPTTELSWEAGHRTMRWQAAIFPRVPEDLIQPCPRPDLNDPGKEKSCGDLAHVQFVKHKDQVKIWGPSVVDFLRRMGVK